MANLTKQDLVVRSSDETGVHKAQVFAVIQKTLDYITESVAKGNDVELRNFGVFEIRLSKPRVGRNPNERAITYDIPERAFVKFKMGKLMRQKMAGMTALLKRNGA